MQLVTLESVLVSEPAGQYPSPEPQPDVPMPAPSETLPARLGGRLGVDQTKAAPLGGGDHNIPEGVLLASTSHPTIPQTPPQFPHADQLPVRVARLLGCA